MPFKSKAQRGWMFANDPEMAKRWAAHTPKGTKLPDHVKKGLYAVLAKLASQQQATPSVQSQAPIGPPNVKYPNGTMTETQLKNIEKAYAPMKPKPAPPPTLASWAAANQPPQPAPMPKQAESLGISIARQLRVPVEDLAKNTVLESYTDALTEFYDKLSSYLTDDAEASQSPIATDGSVLGGTAADTAVSCESHNTALSRKEAASALEQLGLKDIQGKQAMIPAIQLPNAGMQPNAVMNAQTSLAAMVNGGNTTAGPKDMPTAEAAMEQFVNRDAAPPTAAAQSPQPATAGVGGVNVIGRNGLGGPNASMGGPAGVMTGLPGAKTAALDFLDKAREKRRGWKPKEIEVDLANQKSNLLAGLGGAAGVVGGGALGAYLGHKYKDELSSKDGASPILGGFGVGAATGGALGRLAGTAISAPALIRAHLGGEQEEEKTAGVPSGRENCAGCGASMEKSEEGYCNSCGCNYETGETPAKGLYHEGGKTASSACPHCGMEFKSWEDGNCNACGEPREKAASSNQKHETPALDFLKRTPPDRLAKLRARRPSPGDPNHEW